MADDRLVIAKPRRAHRRKRAGAPLAALLGAFALAATYFSFSPQTRAAATSRPEDFSMFGLKLGMTEKEAFVELDKHSSSAPCSKPQTASPYPDVACWTALDYRENGRVMTDYMSKSIRFDQPGDLTQQVTCRVSAALRKELKGEWSALLRVYFTGLLTIENCEKAPTKESTDLTVYRIEWSLYWLNKDLWLASARKSMCERVLDDVDHLASDFRRPRLILDRGMTHRYEWKERVNDKDEQKQKSYILFDISFEPQLKLVVSKGEYDEIYVPREDALAAKKSDREKREGKVEAFLTDGPLPRLPLP